jgi:hypothetical protein
MYRERLLVWSPAILKPKRGVLSMGRVKELILTNQELRDKAEKLELQEWFDERHMEDLAALIDENDFLTDLIRSARSVVKS